MSHTLDIPTMARPLTYIQILSITNPDIPVAAAGDGSQYENLIVPEGTILPTQAELDAEILEDFKYHRIIDLSAACQRDIISGFESDGLGELHFYDSEELDQLNLIGAVANTNPDDTHPDGYVCPYAVRPILEGVLQPKNYVLHTNAQLRKVLADGANVKIVKLQKFNTKRNQVNAATNLLDVNAVTWTSV